MKYKLRQEVYIVDKQIKKVVVVSRTEHEAVPGAGVGNNYIVYDLGLPEQRYYNDNKRPEYLGVLENHVYESVDAAVEYLRGGL